jgi:hypothetical protein
VAQTSSAHHDQAQQHPAQTEIASGVVGAQMLRQMRVQSDAAQIPNQPLQPCVRRDPFPVNSITI